VLQTCKSVTDKDVKTVLNWHDPKTEDNWVKGNKADYDLMRI